MKIEINNLTKEYDELIALNGVNITLSTGMYGLLGANGAGKSTLMKILAGILDKTSGEIKLDGNVIKKTGQIRKLIGYIPQTFSFYPNMTVFEIMDYFSALNGVKENRKERIGKLLEMTHLTDKSRAKVKELSGGMKQRLGIAAALVKDPDLLLVDEPTVGLDPKERVHFSNVLMNFSKDKIILLSSHIVSDIESTCENLAILNYGNAIYNGSKKELLDECNDKVWEFTTSLEESVALEENFSVSSKNIYHNGAVLRVVSEEKPAYSAINVPPTLNDAYIYKIDEDDKKFEESQKAG
ncbi:MAG: ATP-binding cassette domain-containing protein [Lachnospiraceae bacterium]|nr:ATP-binding cassette domain-containing protein [Lachnospiraceae bacterium]